MQDPHLKRSMEVVMYRMGLGSFAEWLGISSVALRERLKSGDVEKNVMFQEETLISNADQSKDRFSIYRNRKLSKEDKRELYEQRPDLDPKFRTFGPNDKGRHSGKGKNSNGTGPRKSALKNNATISSPAPQYRVRSSDCSDDLQLEAPLLATYRESFNSTLNPMQQTDQDASQQQQLATSPSNGRNSLQIQSTSRAQSTDSQQSVTLHDVMTLSNLALTAGELVNLDRQSHDGANNSADVEAGSQNSGSRNGDDDSSSDDSSDDEIDEEDEYLMQPPSQ
jgi:hypothetical protein